MNKKIHFLWTLVLCVGTVVHAQQGYVQLSNRYISNAPVVDQGTEMNCRTCCVIEKNARVYYTPEQVSEYRIAGGNRYISRWIEQGGSRSRFFLEEVVQGEMTLLRLFSGKKAFYYIEVDSALICLPSGRDHQSVKNRSDSLIKAASEKPAVSKTGRYLGYRQYDLEGFVNRYNNNKSLFLINSRINLSLGYAPTTFYVSYKTDPHPKNYQGTSLLGFLSLDVPIMHSIVTYHPTLSFGYRIPDDSISRMTSLILSLGSFRANARIGRAVVFCQWGTGFGYISSKSDIRNLNFQYRFPFWNVVNLGIGCSYDRGPYSFSLMYNRIGQYIENLDFFGYITQDNISLSFNF
ncbi:MAG: hypothetical protein ACOYXB_13385 [Bacteroidota bacterium]